jgi:orotidine-5'-phosphate decarboxylase
MKSHSPRNALIVALDFSTEAEALRIVEQLAGEIDFFKIGLQLYTAAGPGIVGAVMETGAKIFLDLKLHDIPNTVAGAVAVAGAMGVQMLTVHLSGGRAMVEAAVAAKTPELVLLGVTVLTSADEANLREIGISSSIDKQVQLLADFGVEAGINGLVASPHEIKMLRSRFGDKIKIITPGVRPSWSESGDQKRFMTPDEALRNGADYLVIGRPVTEHKNPREAVRRILDEISPNEPS